MNTQGSFGRRRRYVSARDLSRATAALLDEMARDGTTFMVARNGRPIALLTPLEDEVFLPMAAKKEPARDEELSEEIAALELDPLQQRILLELSDGEPHADPGRAGGESFSSVAMALTRLELARLATKQLAGYRITRKGAWLATVLQDGAERDV